MIAMELDWYGINIVNIKQNVSLKVYKPNPLQCWSEKSTPSYIAVTAIFECLRHWTGILSNIENQAESQPNQQVNTRRVIAKEIKRIASLCSANVKSILLLGEDGNINTFHIHFSMQKHLLFFNRWLYPGRLKNSDVPQRQFTWTVSYTFDIDFSNVYENIDGAINMCDIRYAEFCFSTL